MEFDQFGERVHVQAPLFSGDPQCLSHSSWIEFSDELYEPVNTVRGASRNAHGHQPGIEICQVVKKRIVPSDRKFHLLARDLNLASGPSCRS